MTAGRLLCAGLLTWTIGAAAYATLRTVFGPAPAYVSITWAPGVEGTVQDWLERRYSLSRREPRAERSWEYVLTDQAGSAARTPISLLSCSSS